MRILEDDEVYLDLSEEQYEDIFYAIPLDSPNMFMLLNGTVLTEADDRAILTFLCEANGGVDPAMVILQELVKKLKPLKEEGGEPEKPASTPPQVSRPISDAKSNPPKVAESEPVPVSTVQEGEDEPESVSIETVQSAPAGKEEEPFEIVVHTRPQAPDPYADLRKEDPPAPVEYEEIQVKPEGAPAGASRPRDPNRPSTQVFSKKKSVPVEIALQPDGRRVRITVGSKALDLGVVRYEDMYFAMPGDNSSLFRLVNDTILSRPEERDAFRDMLGLLGGVDSGMTAIQNAVLKVEPPPKKPKTQPPSLKVASTPASRPPLAAPKPSTVAPVGSGAKPPTVAPVGSGAKPPTLVPGGPAAKPPTVVPGGVKPAAAAGPGAKPATLMPGGVKPAAAAGPAGKPSTLVPGQPARPPAVAPPKPGIAPGVAGKPATVLPGGVKPAAGPAVPGKAPVVTGPRPFTVAEPSVDDVELVDDVEEIPVAPVAGGDTGAPLGLKNASAAKATPVVPPTSRAPGAPTPATKTPPAQPAAAAPASQVGRRKAKPIDRPQGSVAIKMTKEEVERTGVKIKPVPNGYQIICKEYFIQLSKAQYQELHYALPMPVMNMFKLVHNDLLKDPGSRGVLMKMIHLAGGPKDFMSALSVQVQAIKPTEDWQ